MKSRRKTILTAAVVGLAIGIYCAVTAPRLSPACDEYREKIVQIALSDSGLAGVIIPVPEQQMDRAFLERFGKMTDEECVAAAKPLSAALEALTHTGWAPRMARAGEQAKSAMGECHLKRESGDFKTHAESAECSNPKITEAFQGAGYPYMDLVAMFEARRLEMAKEVDKSMLADTEDTMGFARVALEIAAQEAERVTKK
jgi:hypothetical protein